MVSDQDMKWAFSYLNIEERHVVSLILHTIKNVITSQRRNIVNLSFLVFANVLAAAAGWLTQIKIANTLGKELFGQIAFAVTLGTFGQVFIRVGLDRTLVRDLIHYPNRFEELVQASLYLRYLLFVILFIGLLIWKVSSAQISMNWGALFIVLATSLISLDLQPVYDAWQKIQRHTVYFLIQKICYLFLIWIGILCFKNIFSIFWIGLTLLGSVLIYLYCQHYWAMRRMKHKSEGLWLIVGSMAWLIRNNWLVWLTALMALSIVSFNQLILKKYCGFTELGAYAAAWQLVAVGMLLIEQISRIGRPAMARVTQPGVPLVHQKIFLAKYTLIMIVMVLPLAIVMFAFPRHILGLMFKPEYHDAVMILPILGVYLLMFSLGMVASQYVLSVRLEKIYFASVIIGGILSILLCYLLIPRFNSTGAAWALLVSHGATILIYTFGMLRNLRS